MSALITRRVNLAATRLAVFYCAVVLLEIAVLAVALRAGMPTVRDIGEIAKVLAIPFAVAFLVLATARRWGLIALWAILAAFWIWLAKEVGAASWNGPITFPRLFILWSIFAFPLWLIGQAGLPRGSTSRVSPSMGLLVCWAILLFGGQFFGLPATEFARPHPQSMAQLFAWIWAPVPLILSGFAIQHVWRGTATVATS